MTYDDRQIVASVRAHALRNYNKDGWDYLVECWADKDILIAAGATKNPSVAIHRCHDVVRMLDERRSEVMAEVW
jgi:hypothetical protein